jgi:ornithine decarboxylase
MKQVFDSNNSQSNEETSIYIRKFDKPINTLELIQNITKTEVINLIFIFHISLKIDEFHFLLKNYENEPFYIVDLEDICNKHINWITRLPRVEPHYAIKCNTDKVLIKLLAYLGTGFDCASKGEIQKALDIGVSPHRIIFANPCKQASNIRYANKVGVDYMTFDNENELYKMKENHPNAKCVLRIITNDADAVCRFSMKFGADMATSLRLVELSQELNMNLVGVSFHVGSGQMTPATFSESIENARKLFDYARQKYGLKMHLLDLGGGYPGDNPQLFDEISREINKSLDEFFPIDFFNKLNTNDDNKLKIIAEPGRYYAQSAFTLSVNVIAKRITKQTSDDSKIIMYYINDGVYASFNCIFYDHAVPEPILLRSNEETIKYKSSIWGPTCDGLDQVIKEIDLPELEMGECLVFKNMGAYTLSGAVAFNGIPLARCIYTASTSWDIIKEAFKDEMNFEGIKTDSDNNESLSSSSSNKALLNDNNVEIGCFKSSVIVTC